MNVEKAGPATDSVAQQDIWTVSAAARVLNVSTAYLYKLVDANEIPHHRRGSAILFVRRELTAWIATRHVPAP